MATFGKRTGGGRRIARREDVTTAALVSTPQNNRTAVLTDLSSTGARLKGSHLPSLGQAVTLKIDLLRAFGLVVWSEGAQCGVAFDSALPLFEVERLKREIRPSGLDAQSLEVKLAFEDWNSGFNR